MENIIKKIIFVLLLISCTSAVFGQAKPRLAILPFTGGQGNEGEAIAELFSFDPRIDNVFDLIPRTSIRGAISGERRFQMDSGMTDQNTVISIAHEVGARYVVAGNITSVGRNRLLIIAIMDIQNLQQVAGDFQTYRNIAEIRTKLPGMVENIIQGIRGNNAVLPKLAIVPVQLLDGADRQVADTLAQLLAIHLIRSRRYAIFPRTESLEQVIEEHKTQMTGHTADENVIGVGRGENPDLVFSIAARRLGGENMFNAVIVDLLSGRQVTGHSVGYSNISDGMRAMETLAVRLTGGTLPGDPRKYSSIGIAVGTSLADPWVVGTLRGTFAPFSKQSLHNTFFEIGVDAGFLSMTENVEHLSLFPYARYAFFLPLGNNNSWHIGAGGGLWITRNTIFDYTEDTMVFNLDAGIGFLFFNFLDLSCNLRSDLNSIRSRISLGLIYRFR